MFCENREIDAKSANRGTRTDAKYIDDCRAAGVDRALFTLPSENKDKVLPLVDQLTQYIA